MREKSKKFNIVYDRNNLSADFSIPLGTEQQHPIVLKYHEGLVKSPIQCYRQHQDTGQMYRDSGRIREMILYKHPNTPFEDTRSAYYDVIFSYLDDDVACKKMRDVLLDKYIIVGDRVWEKCPPPMFRLCSNKERWGLSLGNRDGRYSFVFAPHEFNEAQDFISVLDREWGFQPRRHMVLELMPEYKPAYSGIFQGVRLLAQRMLKTIAENVQEGLVQPPVVLHSCAQLRSIFEKDLFSLENSDINEAFALLEELCEHEENGLVAYAPAAKGKSKDIPKLRDWYNEMSLCQQMWEDRLLHRRIPEATMSL